MWNSCNKIDRLKKALEYRGISPERINLDDLGAVLTKRRITDATANEIIHKLLSVLEPPGCQKEHCIQYGLSTKFCNCSLERVPGRCPIHKAFVKRKRERAVKAMKKLMDAFGGRKFNPGTQSYEFFDQVEELNEFAFVKKWNSTLRGDVFRQLRKNRQKPINPPDAKSCAR